MISRFSKIFGKPKDTIVCFGDYEQKKHLKYKEPIKGKGIRNLFKSRGYQIYLVDEFRTSCKCANCDGGCCEKFMFRKSPKPFRKNNNLRLVHGLLIEQCSYDCVWKIDCNGAPNIYK